MVKARDVCDRVAPLSAETTVIAACARLAGAPTLRLLPVIADRTIKGLVAREMLLLAAGRSDALRLPVGELPLTPFVSTEADEAVAALRLRLIDAADRSGAHGFVVIEDGAYLGVGDGLSLLRAGAPPIEDADLLDAVRRDVGAPLQGLLAVAALMQRQPLSLDGAGHLRTIIGAAQSALASLSDLSLHFSPAGLSTGPTLQPASLRALLDEVDVLWQVQAALRGVRLITSCRMDDTLLVEVDPVRFKQVLNALVNDAFDRSPSGVVETRLLARRDGCKVHAEVHVRHAHAEPDKAVGRDGDFARGTLRTVIGLMGGRLRREPNQGAGSTAVFEVTLQVASTLSDNAPAIGLNDVLGHILVVDDNHTNRLVAEALCAGFGFTCETAEDGQEAVEAVRIRAFDIVLMDIKMPRMDGLEATRAIRALAGPGAKTPIVALTANADPEDVARYYAAGMCGVVEKPIKPEKLFDAITDALYGEETDAGSAAAA